MIPQLRTSRKQALEIWRDALSPDLRAAYEVAKVEAQEAALARRARRAQKAAAHAADDRNVVGLVGAGLTTQEIADRIGATGRTVQRSCERLGFERAVAGYRRLPTQTVKVAVRDRIGSVAADLGASVEETLERFLTYAFEGQSLPARRLLRVARRDTIGSVA